MKDFITYDIESELTRSNIYNKAISLFPEFEWRKGDNDSQGKYISGRNEKKVEIQLWLGESPFEMSVCFTGVWENDPNRNNKKEQLIEIIETRLIPIIGNKLNKNEFI